ncbi:MULTISPECIES: ProQ/FINO family protein [Asaia]|uniref:ProQ/FinO domain-containing protein n=1 Tax=Asaia spathodeae TaxID=657016 RepID=A0ABX2P880_9PROT|nr:ProQ/FINO family protein [Asaia spathodeae]GBR20389.1 hypothetical protein AA105894_2548 [Asaia spathodeae NBRC 105894]
MSFFPPDLFEERDRLASAFPAMFEGSNPWAFGIKQQVLAQLPDGCSPERTAAVLRWIATSELYHQVVLSGAVRRNSDGSETVPPTTEELENAKRALDGIEKKRRKLREERKKARELANKPPEPEAPPEMPPKRPVLKLNLSA